MTCRPQGFEEGFTRINSISIVGFLFIFTFKKQSDFYQLSIWRRKWQPTALSLPGETHGQRSLAGCSPWGRKSDMTE